MSFCLLGRQVWKDVCNIVLRLKVAPQHDHLPIQVPAAEAQDEPAGPRAPRACPLGPNSGSDPYRYAGREHSCRGGLQTESCMQLFNSRGRCHAKADIPFG